MSLDKAVEMLEEMLQQARTGKCKGAVIVFVDDEDILRLRVLEIKGSTTFGDTDRLISGVMQVQQVLVMSQLVDSEDET